MPRSIVYLGGVIGNDLLERFALGNVTVSEALFVARRVFANDMAKRRIAEIIAGVNDDLRRTELEQIHETLFAAARATRLEPLEADT